MVLPMFHIVLFEPEIPPNTGNIIRLAANTGCHLHLVEPLGFSMDEKALRRAGLDYHEWASVDIHADFKACLDVLQTSRVWLMTTKAQASFFAAQYQPGDVFVFGPETRGLPADVLGAWPQEHWRKLPMRPLGRSLNLSNAVAVVAYEAWRQMNFEQSA
jgi:tRNA (cytidine/uridine-2'-O-)-methyltransferase